MQGSLPVRLKKEPLVNAIFEIRFQSALPVASILPGALYHQLGCSSITKLPHSDLPQVMRDTEPDLKYVPIIQLSWGQYNISIGDRSIILSCQMPYPGWAKFKESIVSLLRKAEETSLLGVIERYSLKYSDIIPLPDQSVPIENLTTIRSSINAKDVSLSKTFLKTETENDGLICIFQFIGDATVTQPDGRVASGIYIDIDTILNVEPKPLKEILGAFEESIDKIHKDNKQLFFKCLTDEGVSYLEPEYA